MISLIHARCERRVAYILERPRWGDVLDPEKVRLLDGTTPSPSDRLICEHCRRALLASELYPLMGWAR